MNIDFFMEALGKIKPEYVEEAEFEELPRLKNLRTGGQTGKRRGIRSFRALAAGAAAVLVVGTSFHLYLTEAQKSKSEKVTNGFKEEKDNMEMAADQEAAMEKEEAGADGSVFAKATLEELSEYYGMELIPDRLPSDLQYRNGCESEFGFSFGEDGKIISDVNTLVFENESGSRRLLLRYSKIISPETIEGEISVINEREVLLTHSLDENGTLVCRAEFEKDGTFYLLIGEGITEEEITDVLKGLISG